MRRAVVILVVALAAILVGSQLLLPRYLEGRIENRLAAQGGTAEVSLDALPAARLLFGAGDRIEVRGSGLRLDLARARPEVFERLEGFDEVDVRLADLTVGPVRASSVRLSRVGGAPRYTLALQATVSPRELARFVTAQLPGLLGGLFGEVAASALPLADAPIPIELATDIEKVGGRWRASGGAGTIAGLPAGPVAEALATAIVERL